MLEKDFTIYKKKQGLRIRLARRMANMTQPELAEKMTAELGFDFGDDQKVSRIEKGKQDVSGREAAALSAVLNQPQRWLQGIEDDGMNMPIIHEMTRLTQSGWFDRPIEVFASDGILRVA